jgi:hypothetical protein
MAYFRATLNGTGGELDRAIAATLEDLQEEIKTRIAAEWQLMPGDTIQIEEVES